MKENVHILRKALSITYILVQWNPSLTICQGSAKIISLNRDVVIAELPVYR